jgi:hypothetical protein
MTRSSTAPSARISDKPVAIRIAGPADARAVARLAQLDTRPVPQGPLLMAEIAGLPQAARSLATAETIADPFRRTAQLLDIPAVRAEQLGRSERRRPLAGGLIRRYARLEAR